MTTTPSTITQTAMPWWDGRPSIGAVGIADVLRRAGDNYLFVFMARTVLHSNHRDFLGLTTAINTAVNSVDSETRPRNGWDQLPDPTDPDGADAALVLHEALEALFWATRLNEFGQPGSRAAAPAGHYAAAALDLSMFEIEFGIALEMVAHRPIDFESIGHGCAVGLVVGDQEAELAALAFMPSTPLSQRHLNDYIDLVDAKATELVRDVLRSAAVAVSACNPTMSGSVDSAVVSKSTPTTTPKEPSCQHLS